MSRVQSVPEDEQVGSHVLDTVVGIEPCRTYTDAVASLVSPEVIDERLV